MVFHWKRNIAVVNPESSSVARLNELSLYSFSKVDPFVATFEFIHSFSRSSRSSFHFGWILLLVLIIIGAVFLWSRHRRNSNSNASPSHFTPCLIRPLSFVVQRTR